MGSQPHLGIIGQCLQNSTTVDKGTLQQLFSPAPGLTAGTCASDRPYVSSDNVVSWCAYLFFLTQNRETATNDETSFRMLMAPEQITIKAWLSSPEVFGLIPSPVSIGSSSSQKTNEPFSKTMENAKNGDEIDFSFSKEKVKALKQLSPAQLKQELHRISNTLPDTKHDIVKLTNVLNVCINKTVDKTNTQNMNIPSDMDSRIPVIRFLGIAFPVTRHMLRSLNIGGLRGAILNPTSCFCKNKAFAYGFKNVSKSGWANELK